MKRKYKIIIVCAVAVILAVTFTLKFTVFKKVTNVDIAEMDLYGQYETFKETKQPRMIVFSYFTLCCVSSMAETGLYNYEVKKIMKEYEGELLSIFIDSKNISDTDREVLYQMSADYEVVTLPTIILIDDLGHVLGFFEGKLDEEKVKEGIESLN